MILAAADDLFYRQGFEHTSFADIAGAVSISRGNFYYHFKTKDEILDAVIERRLASTNAMLAQWELDGAEPTERIRSFIYILIGNRALIKRYGCPVGTLCSELGRLQHPSVGAATKLFTLFRTWLRRQFTLLGRADDADALAMHVLMRSQGVATLAAAFHDEELIDREVRSMCDWLKALVPRAPKQTKARSRR